MAMLKCHVAEKAAYIQRVAAALVNLAVFPFTLVFWMNQLATYIGQTVMLVRMPS